MQENKKNKKNQLQSVVVKLHSNTLRLLEATTSYFGSSPMLPATEHGLL